MNIPFTSRRKETTLYQLAVGLILFFSSLTYPQRVISLGPSLTEELYLLGAEEKLIGNTVYCTRPPQAKQKPKVGSILKISVEKIISLQPELVLAISLTPVKIKERLTRFGIKVVTFPSPQNFKELCDEFLQLGKLVGKEKKAKEILREVREEVVSLRRRVKHLPRVKVFIQIGAHPLFTITRFSYLNDLLKFAGGKNIAEFAEGKSIANGAGYTLYSRERVVQENPEVIIITHMPSGRAEAEKHVWQRYQSIEAVQTERIYILPSDNFCNPTPVNFARALSVLIKILYPDEK